MMDKKTLDELYELTEEIYKFRFDLSKDLKVRVVKPDEPPARVLRGTTDGVHPSYPNEYIKKRASKIEDAHFLKAMASILSYSGNEAITKHRLYEIAMRIETGFYEQI